MKRVALITGGSRGIGLGIAQELATAGFDLAINGVRDEDAVKDVIEYISPMAEHINDDSAVILLPVVPGGTLRRDGVAFKNPVAKFTADRQYFTEEALLYKSLNLQNAG